ncbi:MAG TPA: alpha/beta hydrolase [Rhizomicrobium sp.]|nr:alpha/beta hydrolase [Rhizomicrobium sp.]
MTAAVLAATLSVAPATASSTYQELLTRPRPTPDQQIAYGRDALQIGDLYLPKGNGPHPVIVLIHGGCWLAELPGREMMAPMIEPLRAHGFAIWNIEYRRIGHDGGGYPGTFLDTARAIDELRNLAPRYHLDLTHVVTVGHSAGGHLAIWASARSRIAKTSALYESDPLRIQAAVSLSGILDLESYRGSGPDSCGGPPTIDAITGRHPDPYADTSPARLVPSGVHQVIFSGDLDHIVPAPFGHAYAKKARAAGDRVDDIEIKGAGHFELIDPKSAAWPTIEAAIVAASK